MRKDDSPKTIEKMMDEFIRNDAVRELFPANYIFEIKNQYEENKNQMTIESFDKLQGFCIYYFQEVFENRFKKTRSFYYIKNLFAKNEIINRRLLNLNMLNMDIVI